MTQNVIQTSFASGELSPSMFARTDVAKYHAGAALMRNFFVDYRNGASNRTGTRMLARAWLDSGVRLAKFQFSVVQGYVLEFGNQYMRVFKNGGLVLNAGFAITGITNAIPGVVSAPGNTFSSGDEVFISGVLGMTEVNGNYYKIINVVPGTSFALYSLDNPPSAYPTPINTTTFGVWSSGGTVSKVFILGTPYLAADLDLLKFSQSASVMTITHPSYPPNNLVRVADNNWTLTTISFATSITAPGGVAIATTAAGTVHFAYCVTAVNALGEESVASTVVDVASVDIRSVAGTITVTWAAVTGAVSYNVYKAYPSTAGAVPAGVAFGFVESVSGLSFVDSNITADFIFTPPIHNDPFGAGLDNPGTSAYFQQRQTFAGSNAHPLTFWMGQPGGYTPTTCNMDIANPIQDDSAIQGDLVSSQVNAIKHLVAMPGGLLALTSGGAWQISGGGSAGITPINAQAVPQAYNGISDVAPIIVNYDILFVQAKGAIIRDLSYNIYTNIYTGIDISILSNHLFFGHTITGWAFAEEPFKVVWLTRDDGTLLSLTFLKEQEIYGWSHSDTLGLYRSVCTITEGGIDAVYVAVLRPLNGQQIMYIERFAEREFTYGAEDAWFVDCGLTNTLPTPVAGLLPAASSGTTQFVSDHPVFQPTDVGSVIRMGGGIATILSVDSQFQVTATLTRDITETFHDAANTPIVAAAGQWSITAPFSTVSQLDHLNGAVVSILGDGSVMQSQTVQNGQITLSRPVTKVIVGLPYTAQLQTMPLDIGEPTIQGKRKKIAALTLRVAESRGLRAGSTFSTMVEVKERGPAVALGQPIDLFTGDERINMDPLWDTPGQICIEQSYPLPATILGVIPEIVVGDTQK